MVTLVTINDAVIVNDTHNHIEYIKTTPLSLELTSFIKISQAEKDSSPSVIELLGSSEVEINSN